jgi:uncharacterized protein
MFWITPIVAAVLTVVYIRMAFNVIGLRRSNKVSLGSGGVDALERAIRAHGNFSEYVPLGLILMLVLEWNKAPTLLVGALGAMLVAGRLIHAKGIQETGTFKNRILGMKLTFGSLGLLALANLGWLAFNALKN